MHATHSTPVAAEIFNREGKKISLIMRMDRGEYEEFNIMRAQVMALLPDNDEAAAMIAMAPEQRQAAIASKAMSVKTIDAKTTQSVPRI